MDKKHNNSVFLSKNAKKVARLESRQTPLASTSNGLNGFYKHINSGALQAAEDPSEITLRYLTGQADFTAFVFAGKGGGV